MRKLPKLFYFTNGRSDGLVFKAEFSPALFEHDSWLVSWPDWEGGVAGSSRYSTGGIEENFDFGPWVFEEPYNFIYENETIEDDQNESETLGVYRPNLNDRKIGKVPMHMVFDGFPHALQHVAEIMGWAADKKGYALHDWKNLPNAHIELPAANYRHGGENSKQKANNIPAIERVDHESAKLHIGHQVFNLLAELELVLTRKIA